LLADGRFPSGGHAHSYGTEPAIGTGDVSDVDDLEAFLVHRLRTTGLVEAVFAAAACHHVGTGAPDWTGLDTELTARTSSPALRAASRSLGRQLLRAGARVWPSPVYQPLRTGSPPTGPLQPLALGAVAHAARLTARDAALCSLHHLAGGITTAAVRLLGLDPFAVAALLARHAVDLDALADRAEATAAAPFEELPAFAAPRADVLAEHHVTWEVRLFAS
jgi:urease accessory protein